MNEKMENMTIRKAAPGDGPSIQAISVQALGTDSRYPEQMAEQRLREALTVETNAVYVAEIEGQIVGYIYGIDYIHLYTDPMKYVMALAVDPFYHGRGIGKSLLQTLEDWAKEEGSAGMFLISGMDRTGAHAFYQHCGYTLRKEEKNYIKRF
jgi:predicted N-acetyltransferase YhbS